METPTFAVCTLWEGDYHKGLGALVNSLVSATFAGTVWAGFRGALPPWVNTPTSSDGTTHFQATPNVRIVFVPVAATMHLSQYKPTFCLQVLWQLDPETSGVYYFDPDVVVLAPWRFLERWIVSGIAVCEDGHYPLNPAHPLAAGWAAYAASKGIGLSKPINLYINSGLVGVARSDSAILELWRDILTTVQQDFQLSGQAHFGTRADLFHNIDQDVFTLALAISPLAVAPVGLDGMAFDRGEWLTLHATGKKPWRRHLIRDFLREGIGVDRAVRRYWQFAGAPIPVESPGRVSRHRRVIPLIALLSRFYARS